MRTRAYFRVSDEKLKLENQIPDVRALCERRGWQLEDPPYQEEESAAKRRPVFDAMMKDAEAHKFDVLVIYALDRFGRSMVDNMDAIRRLDRAGVSVVSHRESWLDTTSGPLRHLLIAIFSYVAESERANLISRTKAGMARARKEGIKIGRPYVSAVRVFEASALVTSGVSVREAARRAGIGEATLRRALRAERGLSGPASAEPL